MSIILRILINAGAIYLIAYLLDGIDVDNFITALIVAVVLGAINLFIKPILKILTLPINLLTLGLFSFILNGLLLLFVAELVDGFVIDGFWAAVFGAFLLSILVALGEAITDSD